MSVLSGWAYNIDTGKVRIKAIIMKNVVVIAAKSRPWFHFSMTRKLKRPVD